MWVDADTDESIQAGSEAKGETLIGLWAQSGHAAVSEVVADAGFDWLLIDGEHAPLEVPTIVDQLRVIEPTGTPAIVRPAWNDPVILKRVLDTGAQTCSCRTSRQPTKPGVPSRRRDIRRQARAAWRRRSAPTGTDAWPTTTRAPTIEICVLVQLETREAVARLEEIAAGGWRRRRCSSVRRIWPPAWGTWGTTPIPRCAA